MMAIVSVVCTILANLSGDCLYVEPDFGSLGCKHDGGGAAGRDGGQKLLCHAPPLLILVTQNLLSRLTVKPPSLCLPFVAVAMAPAGSYTSWDLKRPMVGSKRFSGGVKAAVFRNLNRIAYQLSIGRLEDNTQRRWYPVSGSRPRRDGGASWGGLSQRCCCQGLLR